MRQIGFVENLPTKPAPEKEAPPAVERGAAERAAVSEDVKKKRGKAKK